VQLPEKYEKLNLKDPLHNLSCQSRIWIIVSQPKMIFSAKAIPQLGRSVSQFSALRPAAAAAATTQFSRSFADVQVEHGRGEWKTYGDVETYQPGKYQIKCYNKISPVGLAQFPSDVYSIKVDGEDAPNAHAILLRSYKLKPEEVPKTCRAIAR